MFSCDFCEISKNNFFIEHLPKSASLTLMRVKTMTRMNDVTKEIPKSMSRDDILRIQCENWLHTICVELNVMRKCHGVWPKTYICRFSDINYLLKCIQGGGGEIFGRFECMYFMEAPKPKFF